MKYHRFIRGIVSFLGVLRRFSLILPTTRLMSTVATPYVISRRFRGERTKIRRYGKNYGAGDSIFRSGCLDSGTFVRVARHLSPRVARTNYFGRGAAAKVSAIV